MTRREIYIVVRTSKQIKKKNQRTALGPLNDIKLDGSVKDVISWREFE